MFKRAREESAELKSALGGSLAEQYDRLSRRIESTKTIRFHAHKRLMRRHRHSSYMIAFLSMYVIALSLLPNIQDLSEHQNQILLSSTIVVSVFITVLSLAEASESFHHRAEVLRESAKSLNQLSFQLSMISNGDPAVLDKIGHIAGEYSKALEGCPVNHDDSDYLWIRANRPDLFGWSRQADASSISARAWSAMKRLRDGAQSVVAEFAWMVLPVAVAISSAIFVFRSL